MKQYYHDIDIIMVLTVELPDLHYTEVYELKMAVCHMPLVVANHCLLLRKWLRVTEIPILLNYCRVEHCVHMFE